MQEACEKFGGSARAKERERLPGYVEASCAVPVGWVHGRGSGQGFRRGVPGGFDLALGLGYPLPEGEELPDFGLERAVPEVEEVPPDAVVQELHDVEPVDVNHIGPKHLADGGNEFRGKVAGDE